MQRTRQRQEVAVERLVGEQAVAQEKVDEDCGARAVRQRGGEEDGCGNSPSALLAFHSPRRMLATHCSTLISSNDSASPSTGCGTTSAGSAMSYVNLRGWDSARRVTRSSSVLGSLDLGLHPALGRRVEVADHARLLW